MNDATDDDVESVTARVGEDKTIICPLDYKLECFAWYFCHSDHDCRSRTAWELVVEVYSGKTKIFNETKFGLDPNGSLILKDVQIDDDNNWAICFHMERLIGQDHRSTIIHVFQGNYITFIDESIKETSLERLQSRWVCFNVYSIGLDMSFPVPGGGGEDT